MRGAWSVDICIRQGRVGWVYLCKRASPREDPDQRRLVEQVVIQYGSLTLGSFGTLCSRVFALCLQHSNDNKNDLLAVVGSARW